MTYRDLLQGLEYTGHPPEGQADLVAQDSRKVMPGSVFVCIAGERFDGHAYAEKALAQGAGMVVTQRPLGLPREVTVPDSRAALARMSQNYFGHPGEKLSLVAVTGTNGKTTVSSVLKQVLEHAGKRCGLIGTVRSEIGGMVVPAKFTTPEAWDLNALLARMVAAGCTHAVMEASSQALAQGRLLGLRFKLAVFTNLTRDHLDYHKTMEAYYEAKKLLFSQCDAMLVNGDAAWGRRLLGEVEGPRKADFSAKGEADFFARDVQLGPGSVDFVLHSAAGKARVKFPMPGGYSVDNALAAAGAAVLLGLAPEQAAQGLAASRGVPGRCEVLYNRETTIIRDFAHTADALEKLLSALRPFVQGRMLVLYGCAGERDAAKRIPMSESAVRYGDEIYLTSDNPRGEDPQQILRDALPPLENGGKTFWAIVDRRQALQKALAALREGDMLVLCGKGHEDYQAMDGYTLYLNEAQIVQEWLAAAKD